MSNKRILLSAMFLLLSSFLILKNAEVAYAQDEKTITNGVFIDTIDVSGMTSSEAQAAVNDLMKELQSKNVIIQVGENAVSTTLDELGYQCEANDYIEQALALGTTGNLIKRYKDIKDIEQGNKVYQLSFTFDESQLREFISVEVSKYNVAPENATVARKNGEFIYTEHKNGSKVDIDQTADALKNIILNQQWDRLDIEMKAVMVDDLPEYTIDDVKKVDSLLGSYTTEYKTSAEGRAANLANGARLINNAVIYPGEIFSGYEYMHPFSAANGYYVAHAYLQGKVIDSVGGGACQVTTTLYNAVLGAELEVVQRNAHSMTISYVDLSKDAAIAGTVKDLKFSNSTDYPILIEAKTVDRKITFKIWGHETRDKANRKVKYETVVLSRTEPSEDVITEDPTLEEGKTIVTQSKHTGYSAELYKVVYENGVEVSRTLVNKSYYQAAPNYITVGTKKVEEDTDADADDEDDTDADADADADDEDDAIVVDPDDEPLVSDEGETSEETQSTEDETSSNSIEQVQGDIYRE